MKKYIDRRNLRLLRENVVRENLEEEKRQWKKDVMPRKVRHAKNIITKKCKFAYCAYCLHCCPIFRG